VASHRESQPGSSYPPIADYALVGDCHTAALIARDGSVDWFCPGRFDGPAVFCRLLDADRGGYLQLAPAGEFSAQRRYRGRTNVLETTFSSGGGQIRMTDLMPVHRRTSQRRGYDVGTSQRLLRLVEGLSGEVELNLRFKPTFDYARRAADLSPSANEGAVAQAGTHYLTLACPGVTLEADGTGALQGRLRLRAGERRWIALTYAEDPDRAREALAPVDCDEHLARTIEYWEQWAAGCTYQGPYRAEVLRSALVLKLLTYEPTGAVVAAPTTSLPEAIGGERNWDYRYTWLRDASLILYGLMSIGFEDEAADFLHWLEHTTGSDPTQAPQIMYGIDGRRKLPEEELGHLAGYRGSRPVRLGNAAATQRQLDIYGEVLRAASLHYRRAGDARGEGQSTEAKGHQRPSSEAWALLRGMVERAGEHWQEPGSGIWEVRGGPQDFLYGKLMCWAALDCGIRLTEEHQLDAPLDHWRQTRQAIRRAILERGYDAKQGAFTQAFGSPALDASALAIPRIGFLPPTDARVRSTVERIRADLTQDGLVYRYRTHDGLAGGEGTFALCTFWLVDALALGGRLDQARELFEGVLRYANDVGLLSEEINPGSGELLGNFPQGFSHLALIGSAVNMAKAAKHGAEEQSETEAERTGRASQAAAEDHSARPRAGRS